MVNTELVEEMRDLFAERLASEHHIDELELGALIAYVLDAGEDYCQQHQLTNSEFRLRIGNPAHVKIVDTWERYVSNLEDARDVDEVSLIAADIADFFEFHKLGTREDIERYTSRIQMEFDEHAKERRQAVGAEGQDAPVEKEGKVLLFPRSSKR